MNSAAAIIDVLVARGDGAGRLRHAALDSWHGWIDRLSARPPRHAGAAAHELVEQLAARPVGRPPPRSPALTRWQAFATLWRQHWTPAEREERPLRAAAGGVSFVWHVVLALALMWISALHLIATRPAAEEEAVRVEFIGRGTPEAEGGGPVPSPAPEVRQESPSAAAKAASAQAAPPLPTVNTPTLPAASAPPAEVAVRDVPPTPSQPLVVSAPSPEPPVFTLPPTTMPTVPAVPIPPERVAPPTAVRNVPVLPDAPRVALPSAPVTVDPVDRAAPSVATRAIPAPLPAQPTLPNLPSTVQPPMTAPDAPQVAQRSVPVRASPATAATPSAPAAPSAASAPRPAAGPVTARPSTGVGIGPRPQPAPGSWATPRRADDWGESARNRPGRDGSGLFDRDGRPRLGEAPGSASAGRPPGMITQEIADLDRAGTWLRRPPNDFEPTRFERLWRPNRTLLEEWVERGVRQVSIPVPGSKSRLVCVVSVLQAAGGCRVENPDLNEQPAVARPPPDVPFKPHLQGGNGSAPPAG